MFDSDVLIGASRRNEAAERAIDSATERTMSVISFMELLQGARSKLEARQLQESLRRLQFRILPLSEQIGATAVAIIERYSLSHGIQLADALIAATAIELGESLCSGNVKHFRPVKDLSLVTFRP